MNNTKKGWRRNELGGRECGILPARTDQTRLRQNGDTLLCAPKNLKRDKRSADKNSLLLLLLKNNQSIVYQSRRSFLFINRRPNERDETREHETARKRRHTQKKRFEPGWTRTAIFEGVFLVVRFWMMCCCLPSSPFLSFFGIWRPRSSLLKFFKARKKKEKKKRGFGAQKPPNKSSPKTRRSLENTTIRYAKRSTIMVVRVSCERRSNGLVGIFDARSLGRGSLSNVARGRKEEAHLEIFALKSSRFPGK